MKQRLYKSGTIWCFWRWTITDSEYITRFHLIKTPWFAICLHWINKPDAEPWLHDHPVSFLSIILRGGYKELRSINGALSHIVTHNWFNFIRATKSDCHTIVEVKPRTLTLALMGPKIREWGFHTQIPLDGIDLIMFKLERDMFAPEQNIPKTRTLWIHWKDYYAKQRAERGVAK